MAFILMLMERKAKTLSQTHLKKTIAQGKILMNHPKVQRLFQ
jgi:hypothetical protein